MTLDDFFELLLNVADIFDAEGAGRAILVLRQLLEDSAGQNLVRELGVVLIGLDHQKDAAQGEGDADEQIDQTMVFEPHDRDTITQIEL